MAIPIRTVIKCPHCGTKEAATIADTSVGPRGRISNKPLYSGISTGKWSCSGRTPEDTLSCKTCRAKDFITLREQVRIRGR